MYYATTPHNDQPEQEYNMTMLTNHDATTADKPSIVRDALLGIIVSVGVGLLSSFVFVFVVLLFSGNAMASLNDAPLAPNEVGFTDLQHGSLLFKTQASGALYGINGGQPSNDDSNRLVVTISCCANIYHK